MKKCIVENCGNKHEAKGYCSKHYMQLKTKGRLLDKDFSKSSNLIELSEDGTYSEVIIHDSKYQEKCRVKVSNHHVFRLKAVKVSLAPSGYVQCWYYVNKKRVGVRLTRFLLDISEGSMSVYHRNKDLLDCRDSNLLVFLRNNKDCINTII